MKKSLSLTLLGAASFLLASCGPLPFSRVSGGLTNATVRWTTPGNAIAHALKPEAATRSASAVRLASRGLAWTTAEVTAAVDAYYSSLGTLKYTYTPEVFRIWSWSVISNPGVWVELGKYWDAGDYAALDSHTPIKLVPKAFYDILFIHWANEDFNHLFDGVPFVPRNSIVVSMPEYVPAGTPTYTDVVHYDGINMNRQYLGDNRYHFSLTEVLPSLPGMGEINFVIFGAFPSVQLYVDDSYDTSLFTGNDHYGSRGTNGSSILIPWEGTRIEGDVHDVQLEVVLNLDNIIEVYGAPGPPNSADKVVLAKRFWERFSLNAIKD